MSDADNNNNTMDADDVAATALAWGDDALEDVVEDPSDWTQPTRAGTMVHDSGARIEITGATGRFVAVTPGGAPLRGDAGGNRYFGSYSAAIEALREAGYLT